MPQYTSHRNVTRDRVCYNVSQTAGDPLKEIHLIDRVVLLGFRLIGPLIEASRPDKFVKFYLPVVIFVGVFENFMQLIIC